MRIAIYLLRLYIRQPVLLVNQLNMVVLEEETMRGVEVWKKLYENTLDILSS